MRTELHMSGSRSLLAIGDFKMESIADTRNTEQDHECEVPELGATNPESEFTRPGWGRSRSNKRCSWLAGLSRDPVAIATEHEPARCGARRERNKAASTV